jgi:SAM-dependent methyltransferase
MEFTMISVITPSNNCAVVRDAYFSLQEQTIASWEWVLLLNGGAVKNDLDPAIRADSRVKIVELSTDENKVGALKRIACAEASGEIIVELDHDDLLTPDALAEVLKAFAEHPKACFVYSNFAQVHPDWSNYTFGDGNGWEYRPFEYKGKVVNEVLSPKPYPQNMCLIWFAPNHVRAWKTAAYWAVGGHDQTLKVIDDLDLVCRLYLYGDVVHIEKCLYIYKVHGNNTWLKYVDDIQLLTWDIYYRYITRMAEKWCRENNLKMIDLCGGVNKPEGYISIDMVGGDIMANLDEPWPLEDNSVGIIRAQDAIEHLKDPIHTMNEIHRVLAQGGFAFIMVPSTDGRGAFQDPTHVSFWNQNSFWYYTKESHRMYGRGKINARFQTRSLRTFFPNEFCQHNNISYVEAHLLALKDDAIRFHGVIEV